MVFRNAAGCYAAVEALEIKDDTRGDDSDESRFRCATQPDGSGNFAVRGGLQGAAGLAASSRKPHDTAWANCPIRRLTGC